MDHEERCAELYRLGNRPMDVPDGLLVVGTNQCMLCKNSMRNNAYATQASDGTPVTWLNIYEQDGLYKFYTTPGIHFSEEHDCAMTGEHKLNHTPIYLWVENGRVKGGPIAHGELAEGQIDKLVAACRNAA